MAEVKRSIKYLELANRLQTEIRLRRMEPGTPLLAAPKLAEKYRVSLKTVTNAMRHLAEQGVVLQKQGSGTVVGGTADGKRNFLVGCTLHRYSFDGDSKIIRIIAAHCDLVVGKLRENHCRIRFIPIEAYSHPEEAAAYFGGLDGLLISGATLLESSCGMIEQLGLPTVVFQTGTQWKLPVSQIVANHAPGIREMFRRAERRYDGLIVISYWYPNSDSRREVFVKEALRAGYRPEEIECRKLESDESVFRCGRELAGRCRNKLIFSCSDMIAWSLVGGLQDAGLRFKQDYELVSYDNFEAYGVNFWGEPTVTSIDFPMKKEAELAAEKMLDRLKHPDGTLRITQLPTRLIIRKTALERLNQETIECKYRENSLC